MEISDQKHPPVAPSTSLVVYQPEDLGYLQDNGAGCSIIFKASLPYKGQASLPCKDSEHLNNCIEGGDLKFSELDGGSSEGIKSQSANCSTASPSVVATGSTCRKHQSSGFEYQIGRFNGGQKQNSSIDLLKVLKSIEYELTIFNLVYEHDFLAFGYQQVKAKTEGLVEKGRTDSKSQSTQPTRLSKDLALPSKSNCTKKDPVPSKVLRQKTEIEPSKPQSTLPIQLSKDPAPPSESSGTKKAPLPNKDQQKKTETKPSEPQNAQPIQLSKDPAPTFESSGTKNAPVPNKDQRKKTKAKPSKPQSTQPTRLSKDPAPPSEWSGTIKAPVPNKDQREKTKTKPSKPQSTQPIRLSKDPAPPSESSGTKRAPLPSKDQHEKIEIKPSKPSSKEVAPTGYIRWNGLTEVCQPVRGKCYLCDGAISYAAEVVYGSKPCKVQEVSVLHCGHVFHSDCLEFVTPQEQSRDPPCYRCASSVA